MITALVIHVGIWGLWWLTIGVWLFGLDPARALVIVLALAVGFHEGWSSRGRHDVVERAGPRTSMPGRR